MLHSRWPHVVLFTLVATVLASSVSTAGAPDGGVLLFLGNKNIAPVVYLEDDASSEASGVAVDITRALATHLGRPIQIKAMDWPTAQALVARGEADALIQMNETEERRKIYDFSDPLLESQFSIFVHTDRVGISGFSSLRGVRVGAEAAGLPWKTMEKDSRIHLVVIPNFVEGFKLLNEGRIDAVVVDYRVGSYVLAENNIRSIRVAGDPIAFSSSAFAVKKGNSELLRAINDAMRTIRADGTYQRILDEWRPKEAVFYTRERIEWFLSSAAIVTLLALLATAAVWALTLRRELLRRRIAERRLNEETFTLHGIIDSANAIVFSVDQNYRYTSFNKRHAGVMKALYGAEIEYGHTMLDYMTVLDDRTTAKRNLDRALAGEQLVEEAYSGDELRARQYFQVSHSPIKTEREIIGVAVLAQDMTGRKQAEEEVRKLNKELEQRVADRTVELEAANRELEAFAHSVSHDLRAPLRHLDGFVALLKARVSPTADAQSQHYMDRISAAAKSMAVLIDDLLSFSRMGRQELSKMRVDLFRLVREVIDDLGPDAASRDIHWQIGDLPIVVGDLAMLRIVFSNLISNAIKFTQLREQAEIEIGCTRELPSEITVFVRDNGVGFDMRYADKLFGVFQRLHRADEFEGTGIGLANVRRIISRHGGRTWAKGELNQGATFFLSLPEKE